MKNMTLSQKLITFFLVVSIIPMAVIGIVAYFISSNALQEAVFKENQIFTEQVDIKLDAFFNKKISDVSVIGQNQRIAAAIPILSASSPASEEYKSALARMTEFTDLAVESYGYTSIILLDNNQKQVYTYSSDWDGCDDWGNRLFIKRIIETGQPDFGQITPDPYTGFGIVNVGGPVIDTAKNEIVGTIIIATHFDYVQALVTEGMETIGKSADVYLVNSDYLLTTNSAGNEDAFTRNIETTVTKAVIGEGINKNDWAYTYLGIYPDYRGINVLGAASVVHAGE